MNIWHVIDSFFYSKNVTRKAIMHYIKIALAFVFVILAVLVLYFGQKTWINWREQEAQKSLAQIITRFHEAQEGKIDLTKLHELHETIEIEKERHRSSYLAPYFITIQAEIFIKEGRLSDAVKALDSAISFQTDPVTKNMLETKRALLLLDVDPEKGITQLKELIENRENSISDIAQFYLGRYYWVHNNIDEATKIWNELVNTQSQYRIAHSPYAAEANMALTSLSAKS